MFCATEHSGRLLVLPCDRDSQDIRKPTVLTCLKLLIVCMTRSNCLWLMRFFSELESEKLTHYSARFSIAQEFREFSCRMMYSRSVGFSFLQVFWTHQVRSSCRQRRVVVFAQCWLFIGYQFSPLVRAVRCRCDPRINWQ